MDISIFGFKLNVEILILIGVVYLILVGHTLCGCSNYSLMEGMEGLVNSMKKDMDASGNMPTAPSVVAADDTSSKPNGSGKEGFAGQSFHYINSDTSVNTSSWSKPNMTVVNGEPLSDGVKQFLAREPQPVPLPEGEMFMFANTPFKPECCPNSYSNSMGCACMTGPQYNWLQMRAGNNVPYSDF